MPRVPRRSVLMGAAGLAAAGAARAGVVVAGPGPDGALRFPAETGPTVDFARWMRAPVHIAGIDVVALSREDQFVRVRATDGAVGVVKANSRMEPVVSLLDQLVTPRLVGQDARAIERLVDRIATLEYKFLGLALWTAIGHVELAVWDLMGKVAGVRCIEFMGTQQRSSVPIYLSSLNRNTTPEEEVAWLGAALAETGARGVKIKVGGRMSRNADAAPGRQEALVALARRTLGDDIAIYADANGSFDAPTAIRLIDVLEDHGVAILEEPCPFQDHRMTRQVTAHVDATRKRIRIAGGEQDGALEVWRDYLDAGTLHILQPDFMYNGGMLRTLKVARMAHAAGVGVAPHYPRNGVETVELLHFACHVPNLHGLQEYRGRPRLLDFGHSPVIVPREGMLALPAGPGFGADYNPDIFVRGRRLNRPD